MEPQASHDKSHADSCGVPGWTLHLPAVRRVQEQPLACIPAPRDPPPRASGGSMASHSCLCGSYHGRTGAPRAPWPELGQFQSHTSSCGEPAWSRGPYTCSGWDMGWALLSVPTPCAGGGSLQLPQLPRHPGQAPRWPRWEVGPQGEEEGKGVGSALAKSGRAMSIHFQSVGGLWLPRPPQFQCHCLQAT